MKPSDTSNSTQQPTLNVLLATHPEGLRSRRTVWFLRVAVILVLVAGIAFFSLRSGARSRGPQYATQPVTVGELLVKVSATGNLQPTNEVEVSSELSGIVSEVLVDENDSVKKGQILARLDLSKLEDAVTKSRANLAAAEAQVLEAQATVEETRAALSRFEQVSELSGGKVPSKAEMTTAEANQKRAEANQASARASVTQARANLQSDATNLAKASIRSPIDGVVLSRKVEPGQTVAATLQAPVLFTLAEDLSKMKLEAAVDEADVGQVRVDQNATFTVDAWPGRTYTGVIRRVGYGSQTKDNVVSYPAVLAVDNDDLSLRPGMTATADILTVKRENVLLLPNAALRFSPAPARTAPGAGSAGIVGKLMPRPPSQPSKAAPSTSQSAPKVWTLRDGRATAVEVQVGVTNGQVTELLGGSITAGTQIITEAVDTPS